MKKRLLAGLGVFTMALSASSTEQVWEGKISDSACGEFHKVDETGSKHMSDRDCTMNQVQQGARYILVSHGRIYQIQNQNFPGLKQYAGRDVRAAGNLVADRVIAIKSLHRP